MSESLTMPEIGYGVIMQRKDGTDLFIWRRKNGFEPTDETKWPAFGIPEGQIVEKGKHQAHHAPLNVFATRELAEKNAAELQAANWQKNARYFVRRCKGFPISPTKRTSVGGKLVEVW